MQEEILTYNVVFHQARKKLELTLNEYCIADTIYHLQGNPRSKVNGWCYASKKKLGSFMGITEQAVYPILTKLIKKGILERDEDTKYLRTTKIWYENVILIRKDSRNFSDTNFSDTKETLVQKPKTLKKLESHTKETLVNNNTNNNKNYNNKEKEHFSKNSYSENSEEEVINKIQKQFDAPNSFFEDREVPQEGDEDYPLYSKVKEALTKELGKIKQINQNDKRKTEISPPQKVVYSQNPNVKRVLEQFLKHTGKISDKKWDRNAAYNMARGKFYKGIDNLERILDDYFKERKNEDEKVKYLPIALTPDKFSEKILDIIEYFKMNKGYDLIDGKQIQNSRLYEQKAGRKNIKEHQKRLEEAGGVIFGY